MTREQVASEKSKIRLDATTAHADLTIWQDLPEHFKDLVQRSLRLQTRVQRMDADLSSNPLEADAVDGGDNPVNAQINLLKTAFGDR